MIKSFLEKNEVFIGCVVVLIWSMMFLFLGVAIGLEQKEKVPVFIETPAPTTVAPDQETTPTEITTTTAKKTYEEVELIATAYCPCEICCGEWALTRPTDENGKPIVYTASGEPATHGRTIAVDPDFIPFGTKVIIDGHTYIAQDTGSAIEGNHIDIFFSSHEEACMFGCQTVTAYIER